MNLFKKYDIPVPRYTSYPTAPYFHDGIGFEDAAQWLQSVEVGSPLSLYLHVPFCRQLCFYCGCHMKVVNGDDAIHAYATTLEQEIALVTDLMGAGHQVNHIHWGGGTPSVLPIARLDALVQLLQHRFSFASDLEHAMELDPRVLTVEYVNALAQAGITRASLGVQDFNLEVQQAINRVQPYDLVAEVMDWLRDAGIHHINFDLIYGLPNQTLETIDETIRLTEKLRPSRIALFGYAHVPWMKAHQKLLESYTLPTPEERQAMFDFASASLVRAGYVRVGYDHFALPSDSMAQALKAGTLHRNFQGFTVDAASTLVGLGASSISQTPSGYVQNFADISEYRARVENGLLPIQRGVAVTQEDVFRRAIIERIMCDYTVDVAALSAQFGFSLDTIADAWPKLALLEADGLLSRDGYVLTLTEQGRPFVRVVASCFDAYFKPQAHQHARAV